MDVHVCSEYKCGDEEGCGEYECMKGARGYEYGDVVFTGLWFC